MKTMLLSAIVLLIVSCIPKQDPPDKPAEIIRDNNLPEILQENSGMIAWDGLIWFINDSGNDSAIYGYSRSTNEVVRTIHVKHSTNTDWEDISQNSEYIFIGDFGNNASGNRDNLRIYMIRKSDIGDADSVIPSGIINFSYEDQTDFSPQPPNSTSFDCEALVATENSIILFTKDWINLKTKLYTLSLNSGTQVAQYKAEWRANGLVTGACWSAATDKLYMIGYSGMVAPILWEYTGFNPETLTYKNGKTTTFNLLTTQTEGILVMDDGTVLVSSEAFNLIQPGTTAALFELQSGN